MSIFLGFSAANTSNNLIYLIAAAMLGFMGVSGIFGKRNLSKIEVAIEAPNEVFAGVEFPMKITLTTNRGFLPGFLLDVAAESTGVLFPFVQTKTSQFRHVPFTFPTRGTQSIRAIYVCSVFPFNFFIRCTKIQPSKEFLVYPAPKK
ncbi:MAG: hypothetical protein HQK97_01015, partial [Nitrospirae bacterium]|nr:hypothetical protein [Nitrospirota bacterium]